MPRNTSPLFQVTPHQNPKALPKPKPTELLGKGNIQQKCHLAKLPPPLLIPIVKVEKALGRINTQKCGHIFVVGEGGAQPNESDFLLGHLNVSDGPGHQSFQDRTSVIMEEVDLILRKEREIASRTREMEPFPESSRIL